MIWVGIDPGSNGGLAAIEDTGAIEFRNMPESLYDLGNWIGSFVEESNVITCLEKVGGFQGKEHPGSRMFNFGKQVGHIEMALANAEFKKGTNWFEPTPVQWQKALDIQFRVKGETDTNYKKRLKEKAEELFPRLHITKDVADALLIAYYCRITYGS